MEKENKKFKVSFIDADRIKAIVECELTYRNGYKKFTISAHYNGSMGQCQDQIKPANKFQKDLLALDEFHLNGMSAGTDEQNKIVDRLRKYDYNKAVFLLKKYRKYTVRHPRTGKPYQYGSGWIHKELPKNIEKRIINAIAGIEAEELKRKEIKSPALKLAITECADDPENNLHEMDDSCLADFIMAKLEIGLEDAEKTAALVKMFDLCEDDLRDIEFDGARVIVQGVEYLFGTDSEMDQEWDKYLDNYIDDCVLNVNDKNSDSVLERYFDREAFKEDAKMNGRGNYLNRYDGGEQSITINRTEYFAYQK